MIRVLLTVRGVMKIDKLEFVRIIRYSTQVLQIGDGFLGKKRILLL